MSNLKDIKVGDVLVIEGSKDIIVIFVSGELVVCKGPNDIATSNLTISYLEATGYTIKQEPVKEEVSDYIYLKVFSNFLFIKYKEDTIGYINTKGECYILACDQQKEVYIQWLNSKQNVNSAEVTWRDKQYYIRPDKALVELEGNNWIYDFEFARVYIDCNDDNIVRYPVNNTPILY